MDEDIKILSEQEIRQKLKDFPGWIYKDNKIVKQFVFKSFSDGIKLLSELAPFCDRIDHHPYISIAYKKFIFELTRYSVGSKVTERDFKVAAKIEELFKRFI